MLRLRYDFDNTASLTTVLIPIPVDVRGGRLPRGRLPRKVARFARRSAAHFVLRQVLPLVAHRDKSDTSDEVRSQGQSRSGCKSERCRILTQSGGAYRALCGAAQGCTLATGSRRVRRAL